MSDPVLAIGAISGTSMDGIDVAAIETDGEAVVRPVRHGGAGGHTYPYAPDLRRTLLDLAARATPGDLDRFPDLDRAVSDAHAAAIAQFIDDFGIDRRRIAIVGLHGQTMLHRPDIRFVWQFGRGDRVAEKLGLDVVNQFRHADVAAGGQGAPFAPLYHRALAAALPKPVMVLNLGGVANITYIDHDTVIAFDTGPASAMLDDFMLTRRGLPYDADGGLASSGTPNRDLVAAFLRHPYFAKPAPKSLDRNDWKEAAASVTPLSDADGAATLAAFTIESVAAALDHVPQRPARWLVCGGGRHNAFFMRALAQKLGVPVDPVEAVGWDGDFIEAQCFGYLAVRALNKQPLSVPTTTGVPTPMTGGQVWRAA